MKRAFSIIFVIACAIAGCSSKPSVTDIPFTLPIASPTNVETVTPSYTSTVTQTPLPTITNTPTITPTFDPANIITFTPSAPETCPPVTDIQAPRFSEPEFPVITFRDNEQKAIDFLNQGGKPESLINTVKNSGWFYHGENNGQIKDVTGDGVAEIIISPSETYVLGCNNEKYEILLTIDNQGIAINTEQNNIVAIEDINLDGVPELAVASYGCGGMNAGMCLDGWIYEWDGNQFTTIFELSFYGRQESGAKPLMEVKNVNSDKLLELTVTGGILGGADYYYRFPWRQEMDTYAWNGNKFVLQSITFSKPQYRYQVVQDADRAVSNGDYKEAIKQYQNVIYGNYDWFSAARKQYTIDTAYGISATEPEPDTNEKPNLAGYSFFRILVTYVLQGNLAEAQIAYERIHKNFALGFPGYDYVVISDAFWSEYQSNQDIEKACRKAIEYVLDHQDLLVFLGGEHHNYYQDILYKSEDICPFK